MLNLWALHHNEQDYPEPDKVSSLATNSNKSLFQTDL